MLRQPLPRQPTMMSAPPPGVKPTTVRTGAVGKPGPLQRVTGGRAWARSQRAGAEAGDDVVTIGREEVAVARVREPRARGPGAAAQHLARIEPRLRIVLVGVGRK